MDGAERGLGSIDVIVLSLAAAFGAGVFAIWGPAAAAAGSWLPLAVVLAVAVAVCTALSTADVARSHGWRGSAAVEINRDLLPDGFGRLGAVAFLVARAAGVAATAGVFGAYVLPSHPVPIAIAVVVVSTVLSLVGVRATALSSFALVGGTCVVLLMVVVLGLLSPADSGDMMLAAAPQAEPVALAAGGPLGVGTAAGFICFGLAGLCRVSVLAGQTPSPEPVLRRAVPIVFGIAGGTYLLLAIALLVGLGPERLATDTTPLVGVVDGGSAALGVLVRVAAAVAACAALVALQGGLSTTIVALTRSGDLPHWLGVTGRRGVACRAVLLGGVAGIAVLALAGPVATIAVTACCVLVSYAVVNMTALQVPAMLRHRPRWAPVLGTVLASALAVQLPFPQVLVATVVLVAGWSACTAVSRRRGASP